MRRHLAHELIPQLNAYETLVAIQPEGRISILDELTHLQRPLAVEYLPRKHRAEMVHPPPKEHLHQSAALEPVHPWHPQHHPLGCQRFQQRPLAIGQPLLIDANRVHLGKLSGRLQHDPVKPALAPEKSRQHGIDERGLPARHHFGGPDLADHLPDHWRRGDVKLDKVHPGTVQTAGHKVQLQLEELPRTRGGNGGAQTVA